MQKFENQLNYFSRYAKDVKTPEELYEAIDKLGPLPSYCLHLANNKQEDDIYDFESAKKEAQIVYRHARQIAIDIRKSKQIPTRLPPTEDDPFHGMQTIKEWCIDVSQKKPTSGGKPGEAEQKVSGWRKIQTCFKGMIKTAFQIFTKSFWDVIFEKYGSKGE